MNKKLSRIILPVILFAYQIITAGDASKAPLMPLSIEEVPSIEVQPGIIANLQQQMKKKKEAAQAKQREAEQLLQEEQDLGKHVTAILLGPVASLKALEDTEKRHEKIINQNRKDLERIKKEQEKVGDQLPIEVLTCLGSEKRQALIQLIHLEDMKENLKKQTCEEAEERFKCCLSENKEEEQKKLRSHLLTWERNARKNDDLKAEALRKKIEITKKSDPNCDAEALTLTADELNNYILEQKKEIFFADKPKEHEKKRQMQREREEELLALAISSKLSPNQEPQDKLNPQSIHDKQKAALLAKELLQSMNPATLSSLIQGLSEGDPTRVSILLSKLDRAIGHIEKTFPRRVTKTENATVPRVGESLFLDECPDFEHLEEPTEAQSSSWNISSWIGGSSGSSSSSRSSSSPH